MANDVNATGIVGMIGVLFASCRLPENTDVRSGLVLPSLKMITPEACAASAFCTFTPKLHVPRWINAIRPATKPSKSAIVQPLAELGVSVGGMTMLRTGCMSALLAVPVLCPGFQSDVSRKSRAVGETSLNVGVEVYA